MNYIQNRRRLLSGFYIAIFLVIASGIASFFVIFNLIRASRWSLHTTQVLDALATFQSEISNAESAQRGFLLTDNPAFLANYKDKTAHATALVDTLLQLTHDNPEQIATLRRLKTVAQQRIDLLNKMLVMKQNMVEVVGADLQPGKLKMDELKTICATVARREHELLDDRMRMVARYAAFAPVFIAFASLLSIVITLVFFSRLRKDLTGRQRLIEKLKTSEQETQQRIMAIKDVAAQLASGDFSSRILDEWSDELGELAADLNSMATALQESFNTIRNNEQRVAMLAELSDVIIQSQDKVTLGNTWLHTVMRQVDATAGALYLIETDGYFRLSASAGAAAQGLPQILHSGDHLAGRALQAQRLISISETGHQSPWITQTSAGPVSGTHAIAWPVVAGAQIVAVVELAAPVAFGAESLKFLEATSETLGAGIQDLLQQEQVHTLLQQTQAQAEELQAQQEELEVLNQDLTTKAQQLQSSEEELRVQQEELLQSNTELEERSQQLAERNQQIAERNEALLQSADEIRQSNQYKSDFLANMSHELRTPLNSVLLLSRLLSSNPDGNLNGQQVEYAQVIENAGNSLLRLIDELLDLSKIESGKMQADRTEISVDGLLDSLRQMFVPVAEEKGIALEIGRSETAPAVLETDGMRLEQILRNLVSNALKFTPEGTVTLKVSAHENNILFAVRDSGIGIDEGAQQAIFEAFRQADSSTQRKYGGTGLGLAISQRLAALLGGEIRLESKPGEGSTFTLELPIKVEKTAAATAPAQPHPSPAQAQPAMDDSLPGLSRPLVVVIEDDETFARVLSDTAQKAGFDTLVAHTGRQARKVLRANRPSAVLLDLHLPDMQGIDLLRYIRTSGHLHQVPVHVISGQKEALAELASRTASTLAKPVSEDDLSQLFSNIREAVASQAGKLLILEETEAHARALQLYLNENGISATLALEQDEARAQLLDDGAATCTVLAISPDAGLDLLSELRREPALANLQAILVSGRSANGANTRKASLLGARIVIKTAHGYRRILDEAAAFLNLLTPGPEAPPKGGYEVLRGKKVLLADDDARNIFALTRSLEAAGMQVIPALNGAEALQAFGGSQPDAVLMDIMMPVMDGYEATRNIRATKEGKDVPIIAVTAKAMSGDREKCLEAGANDYIAKPVDVDQLLSLLQVWLSAL